jgi:protein-S-isoprenylcysteine O-methyltransferase Ste14
MEHDRKLYRFILEKAVKSAGALMALALLLFILAGTSNVPGFWIYIILAISYQFTSLFIIVPRHPAFIELDEARRSKHPNAKKWDKVLLWFLAAATFLMYGLAALDLGRLHAGRLSAWFIIPGVALYVLSSMSNQWAMIHNPHFEREVRVQLERKHRVIKTGPYRHVRHPGYLGSVLFYLSFPLICGSTLALYGSGLGIVGILVRTNLEDVTLRNELTGYAEYAQQVRYRLVPFVW